ncbi:MAG: DUF262 domain-containing protein [Halomonas sp.]|nr:DUF262 domain-containing protein [Halomonas sp.]
MTLVFPSLKKGILKVGDLLADSTLAIPEYQRPYKWTGKNISQLFSDIATHKDKGAYRLGTIVFHQHDGKRNIVDGQQRTVSLMLAVLALINERLPAGEDSNSIERADLRKQLKDLHASLSNFNPSFDSAISQANIHNNYLSVSRIVTRPEFTEQMIDFLLNQCELVYFELNDISEAFQFFDSQNARGRDLEPHDLLKAFHLREFTPEEEPLKAKVVSHWESTDTDKLARLFSRYLFRIRNWSRGASARYFGKEHTHLFKGVNINRIDRFPYVEQLRMAHHFVDEYNQHYQRRIDGNHLGFPFHLDQIIINGRRFFEMIDHYQQKIGHIDKDALPSLEGFAPRILETISDYKGRHRTGDRYVRSMFDCLLISFIDKFGMVEISRAVEKAFIWAYSLRLKMQVLQLASMDNYVLRKNMFLLIKESTQPADFLSIELPVLQQISASNAEPIEKLFREMRYCE